MPDFLDDDFEGDELDADAGEQADAVPDDRVPAWSVDIKYKDGTEQNIKGYDFIPDPVMELFNDIHFPFEWYTHRIFEHRYAQITLVDDRIAIHKPLVADIEYTKPCKAGDNSYIRSFDMFGTRVPKQFFEALGIKSGDKIDLLLEENCIA